MISSLLSRPVSTVTTHIFQLHPCKFGWQTSNRLSSLTRQALISWTLLLECPLVFNRHLQWLHIVWHLLHVIKTSTTWDTPLYTSYSSQHWPESSLSMLPCCTSCSPVVSHHCSICCILHSRVELIIFNSSSYKYSGCTCTCVHFTTRDKNIPSYTHRTMSVPSVGWVWLCRVNYLM